MQLQGETPLSLKERIPSLTDQESRRIVSSMHRGLPLGQIPEGVRRISHNAVLALATVPELTLVSERRSALDPFRILTLESPLGGIFETVRIPLEKAGRFSVCVSSQVGCALACSYCATGRLGLTRNLEVWEIIEQVRMVRRDLEAPARVHGVVFQGMGEPCANLDRVLAAIRVMSDPSALAIDARQITVTTSGLPAGIVRLAREARNVRLGFSLFSARQSVREQYMPIAKTHALPQVFEASVLHATETNLAPMWAITPLAGINDSEADALALGELMQAFVARTGIRPTLRLVPYNSVGENDPFRRQTAEELELFRAALRVANVGSKMRYSGGSDVQAACGQLASNDGKTRQKRLPLVAP
jgi:23S rRNA (adenine2503-C2)-methyltransferase